MSYRQFAQRIRVPSGFVLLPLLFVLARPTATMLIAGLAVASVGLATRAWASGYLKKNEELTTAGPYAYTRNPLYLGTFLLGAGAALGSGSLIFVAVYLAFYLALYLPVIHAEAETMKKMFPDSYAGYSHDVPLLLPKLPRYRAASSAVKFDPSLYLKHREYQAAIGFVVIYALLVLKWIALAE
ncbi:MAG TPA: isoprenylcysteine carboxylmethyltransferase family protein [Blastocatellia bacterium]|nr:isoprenylcysteine carboxylmethyltransferase family protein [Blastocatellia bacterium]